jgi:hypothetical protein
MSASVAEPAPSSLCHFGHSARAIATFRQQRLTSLPIATSELASWLQADYKLSASEVAIGLGASIEYNISEVADRMSES